MRTFLQAVPRISLFRQLRGVLVSHDGPLSHGLRTRRYDDMHFVAGDWYRSCQREDVMLLRRGHQRYVVLKLT
jgi:hypothetical protein